MSIKLSVLKRSMRLAAGHSRALRNRRILAPWPGSGPRGECLLKLIKRSARSGGARLLRGEPKITKHIAGRARDLQATFSWHHQLVS